MRHRCSTPSSLTWDAGSCETLGRTSYKKIHLATSWGALARLFPLLHQSFTPQLCYNGFPLPWAVQLYLAGAACELSAMRQKGAHFPIRCGCCMGAAVSVGSGAEGEPTCHAVRAAALACLPLWKEWMAETRFPLAYLPASPISLF